jgi:hypothetical protein
MDPEYIFSAMRQFDEEVQPKLMSLLGHKGAPWMWDISCRLKSEKGNLFAVAKIGEEFVSNVYIGYDQMVFETSTLCLSELRLSILC